MYVVKIKNRRFDTALYVSLLVMTHVSLEERFDGNDGRIDQDVLTAASISNF